MANFEALLKGRTLGGRYLVQQLIGRGGMGAVFRALDQHLERTIALKVVNFGDSPHGPDEHLRRRLWREARVASQLKHRNVVAIHDHGVDAALDLDFVVMELLAGVDLARYLAENPTPPMKIALTWLRQAARGVAAGHRVGLIHRDIKPTNLFLAEDEDEDTRLVVLDFGAALPTLSDETLTRLTVGDHGPHTIPYAAPEQLAGAVLTPACDIFSLAATAFELFTGKRMAQPGIPAGSEFAIARARGMLAEPATPVPPAIANVLSRALSLDPQERHRNAVEFGSALDQAYGGSVNAGATPTVDTRRRTIVHGTESRHPILRTILAGLASQLGTALSLGLAVWLMNLIAPNWLLRNPPRPDLVHLFITLELPIAFCIGWGTARIPVFAHQAFRVTATVNWIIFWTPLIFFAYAFLDDTPGAWIYVLAVALGGAILLYIGGGARRTAHISIVRPMLRSVAHTVIWINSWGSVGLILAWLGHDTEDLQNIWIYCLAVLLVGCTWFLAHGRVKHLQQFGVRA